jgi:hypothetical protein
MSAMVSSSKFLRRHCAWDSESGVTSNDPPTRTRDGSVSRRGLVPDGASRSCTDRSGPCTMVR